jgi:hypothetical protein
MPFRQAQGPELADGQRTPNSESLRERARSRAGCLAVSLGLAPWTAMEINGAR